MAVDIRIRVELNGVDKQLLKIAKKDNFRVPLNQSGIYMEGSIAKRFRNGGGSQGAWKPLSPATLKRHPHRVSGKPLNDSGLLKQSVTSGSMKRITGQKLYYTYGSNVTYAGVHNFGWGNKGRGTIPARPFLYFDEADETAIKRIFEEYIKGLLQ